MLSDHLRAAGGPIHVAVIRHDGFVILVMVPVEPDMYTTRSVIDPDDHSPIGPEVA